MDYLDCQGEMGSPDQLVEKEPQGEMVKMESLGHQVQMVPLEKRVIAVLCTHAGEERLVQATLHSFMRVCKNLIT